MEGLAEWLYRRWPRHLMATLQALGLAIVVVTVAPPLLVLAPPVFDLTAGETAIVFAVLVTITVLGTVLASVLSRSTRGRLNAWARGERDDPIAVWHAGTRFTRQLSTRIVLLTLALAVPINHVLMRSWLGRSWAMTISFQAGFGVVAAVGWMVVAFIFSVAMRPLLAEAELLAGPAARPETAGTLGRDLAAGAAALILGATTFSGGFMTLAPDNDWKIFVASAIGLVMTAWTLVVFVLLLSHPLLRPVRDLIGATERVAAGDYSRSVPVATSDEFGELAASFNAMQQGLQERASLHAAFGTFVDPSLTARLLALGDDAFSGEAVEVTILFVDVRGFTPLAASMDPAGAVALLNRLFATVVPVVRERAGHPNHFLGDGLLAVFGAPDPVDDHADQATAAALAIQAAVRAEFGDGLRVGIGLNTGTVIAGTIGGGGKLEYTVIGDAVNVAARVEQLTKVTGDAILMTAETAGALRAQLDLVDRGRHEIRGKTELINILAVPC